MPESDALKEDRKSFWLVTDFMTIKATGDDTQGAFSLFESVTPPGGGTPPHVHRRENESFYVLEGEVTFYTEGRSVVAGPGTFFYAPRNTPHHYTNQGSVPAKMVMVASPPGFEKFVEEAGIPGSDPSTPPPPPTPEQVGRLVEIAAQYGIEIIPPD